MQHRPRLFIQSSFVIAWFLHLSGCTFGENILIENATGEPIRVEISTSQVQHSQKIGAWQTAVQPYRFGGSFDQRWGSEGPTLRAFDAADVQIFCRTTTWKALDSLNWRITVERGRGNC